MCKQNRATKRRSHYGKPETEDSIIKIIPNYILLECFSLYSFSEIGQIAAPPGSYYWRHQLSTIDTAIGDASHSFLTGISFVRLGNTI